MTNLLTVGGFATKNGSLASNRNDFPGKSATANQPTTFVIHAANLRSPGSLDTVTVFENFNVRLIYYLCCCFPTCFNSSVTALISGYGTSTAASGSLQLRIRIFHRALFLYRYKWQLLLPS